ncbi:glycosyltransferase family 4 protein [Barnesiella sp. ET7]|uniref:glycosyltransferase family 4 protein n=1 Tax=Barnesiella sp. ET7 TaxID=2972460 RepID=UPI0021AC03F8|nr:glycosyltransferase family 1 protein [Barnesiella sp. ET7]MCR8912775.1 glycosyltransferase family 4 protein [Barnesiella sp. ET7]
MMKILLDLTYIDSYSITGVTNYAYRLLDGFIKCNFNKNVVLLVTSENAVIVEQNTGDYEQIVIELKTIRRVPYFNGLLNKRQLDKIIENNKIDLFFSPYIVYHGLYTSKIPFVGVFHDAQGFKLMESPIKQLLYNIFTKRILSKTTKIVTISNFSKNDIVNREPQLKERIEVIYNSILPVSRPFNSLPKSDPYILNVNTLEPYKNLITLVKAFNLLKDKIPHMLFVKAQRLPYWDNIIFPYMIKYGLENRIKLIEMQFSEEEMASLYSNADLFVSPSLMEGFGFTPIEAALYEIPVICSKESALVETTKGLLNYYEPATDEKKLAETILQLINNPIDKAVLSSISLEYINSYSTKNQAGQFIALFNTIV